MSGMRLYEIAEHYKFLLGGMVNEETGEIDETVMAKLSQLTDPLETKCINITRIFKSLEAEAEAIEKERKAMAAREKALKGEVERLKDYLLDNMQKTEITEIKCPQFVIKLRKNPPSVDAYDESVLPDKYKKV